MTYVVLPRWQWQEIQETQAGQDYLAQMLHLRNFFSPPPRRGPEMVVYRFWRMQVETDARIGPAIRLVGYDQSAGRVVSGESVTFRFYWQAGQTPDSNYSLFVHLTPLETREVLAQADGDPPARSVDALWNEAASANRLPIELRIPADLPPDSAGACWVVRLFEPASSVDSLDGTPLVDRLNWSGYVFQTDDGWL
jgi:hypothetical protein